MNVYELQVTEWTNSPRPDLIYEIHCAIYAWEQCELDLVCRKRAVSNSRPACREVFKFIALLSLLATVGLCCSAYICHGNSVVRTSITRVYCIKTAEPVSEILSLSAQGTCF